MEMEIPVSAETAAPEKTAFEAAARTKTKRYRGKRLTAIVVDETIWPKFIKICKLQDVSASAVLRKFVAEYVAQHEHLLPHE